MKEEALLFGPTETLVGIVTDPPVLAASVDLPAFIFLNAGIIHRVGTNRLNVGMARDLAASGLVTLRFDFSGIGDSIAARENLPFEERWIKETQAAMQYLGNTRGSERFVLVGNCSGAHIAMKTACCDSRVVGVGLLNLGARKIPLRYYRRLALSNPKLWLRILRGNVQLRRALDTVRHVLRGSLSGKRGGSFMDDRPEADLRLLTERGVRVLLAHCEWDPNYDYFRVTRGDEVGSLTIDGMLEVATIEGMNHDFYLLQGQNDVLNVLKAWTLKLLSSSSKQSDITAA